MPVPRARVGGRHQRQSVARPEPGLLPIGVGHVDNLPTWKSQDWINSAETPYAEPFIATAEAGMKAFFPELVFSTVSPWVASTVSNAVSGKSYDIDAGLADVQRKADAWVAAGG